MKTSLFFLPIIFLLASCHSSDSNNLAESMLSEDSFEAIMDVPHTAQPTPSAGPAKDESKDEVTKKIIKTGYIRFESRNTEINYKEIVGLLPSYGAYIDHETQEKNDHRIEYQLTIRVPANHFDKTYSTLSSMAFKLEERSSNVDDVTQQYYDLKTRIANKQALEQRYLKLLDKATEIKDILEIEKNINDVRNDIESMQTSFRYLSKQIAYSTLNVTFYETLTPEVSNEMPSFGRKIANSLIHGWDALLFVIVGLTTLWPFFLLIAIIILVIKVVKKKKEQ